MIIIDVIEIDGKSSHDFRNAGVPSRIVDCAIEIVHASRIRFRFRLLSEDGRVEQNICDILNNVVLSLDLVHTAQNLDGYTFGWTINGIFDISDAATD